MKAIDIARQMGTEDGTTAAREGRADGSYRKGGSSDWDGNLINAVGNRATREAFGLSGDAAPSDDPEYSDCLRAYNAAATAAYDAAGRTITKITTGFLTGNFGDEIDPVATAAAWKEALQTAYPGAEIEIGWQHAEGSKPFGLKTLVEFDDGTSEHESHGLHGACEEIHDVLERVEPVWTA
jgi:hypothetical protein